jgi:outer membrane protein
VSCDPKKQIILRMKNESPINETVATQVPSDSKKTNCSCMKKESLIIASLALNMLLLVSVIVLFATVFGAKRVSNSGDSVAVSDSTANQKLAIAYINVDSLLLNYEFAKHANESLIKKQEDARLEINSKARQLQNDMSEFQRKLDNNAFLSRERAAQEQARLIKRQEELQERDQQLTQLLMQAQQKLSEQLHDTIDAFIKDYNKIGKYEMILSNTSGDNILYAAGNYDITAEVIRQLNKRYTKK